MTIKIDMTTIHHIRFNSKEDFVKAAGERGGWVFIPRYGEYVTWYPTSIPSDIMRDSIGDGQIMPAGILAKE